METGNSKPENSKVSEEKAIDKDTAALIAALKSRFPWERLNAVFALAEKKAAQAIPVLVEALQDETYRAWKAVDTLGEIGDPQAIPTLLQAFKAKKRASILRGSVTLALGMIEDPEFVPFLIEALKNDSIAWQAAEALAKIGFPSAPALITVLETKDTNQDKDLLRRQRYYALQALRAIEDPKAAPILIKALGIVDLSISAGWDITDALVKMGAPAVPALVEAIRNQNKYSSRRLDMVRVLARIGDAQAIPALIQVLGNKGEVQIVSCEVAETLKQMAEHHPHPALRAALPILRRLRNSDPAFEEALEQIEIATAMFKNLPLPASAPLPDTRTLPRPAAVPLDASVTAPRGFWTRLRRALEGS